MKSLIRFFAANHTLANVLTLLIILLGISALSVIQRDNFPSVDLLEMTITTRYPGASPEDVELNVTNEIEEELEEVDGIDRYTSYSMENISIVRVWLDRDAGDSQKIKTDVRDAVSRASDLPIEVDEEPLVEELTTSTAIPIIEVGLTGAVSYRVLRDAARLLEKRLLNVEGVGSITKYGYLDREIKVVLSSKESIQAASNRMRWSASRCRSTRSSAPFRTAISAPPVVRSSPTPVRRTSSRWPSFRTPWKWATSSCVCARAARPSGSRIWQSSRTTLNPPRFCHE